jgi:general secretion pathway protein H
MVRTSLPRSLDRKARTRGFSLIEVLVVVVILGVVVGAVALSVGGGASRELEVQATRLQALLRLGCEQSELTGRDLGIFLSRDRIEFAWRGPDRWYPLTDAPREPLRPRQLDDGVEWSLERDGERLGLLDDAPADPQLLCLSSGELSPFQIELSRADVPERWQLEGRPDGQVLRERWDG